MARATRRQISTRQVEGWTDNPDTRCGYGYQFWLSRHGYRAEGSFGQMCVVVPSHDLVVALTAGLTQGGETLLDPVWDCLLPGLDPAETPGAGHDDAVLAARLRSLALPRPDGTADRGRTVAAGVDTEAAGSALPRGGTVVVDPADAGWVVRLGALPGIAVGHGSWRESAPLGRPVVAAGGWQGPVFVADLYVVTSPHRVRLEVDTRTGTATATWNLVPLTGPDLEPHLRSPLRTRPDVA